jgi:hypothetical protein
MSVGVMEDYKLRDLRASHTLGWSWNWKTFELLKESRAAKVKEFTGRLR